MYCETDRMKTCPTCGKKYPENALMCEEDWTPLTDAHLKDPPPPVKCKIPTSLLVVIYLFFIQGISLLIGSALVVVFIIYSLCSEPIQFSVLPAVFDGLGVLAYTLLGTCFLKTSQGLRRYSNGWRNCALVYQSLCLALVTFTTVNYFLPIAPHSHLTKPGFWMETGLAFLISAGPIFVLCHQRIKSLFLR
jgi:multidrug transporter EmrE-like cation transporter